MHKGGSSADEPVDPEHTRVHYPMRLVTRMTGLSAATIRAWERRYSAVAPRRSEGNTRLFSSDDVRRLTLLRQAVERGHAIREVARLEEDALEELVGEDAGEGEAGRLEPTSATARADADLRTAYLDAVSRFEVGLADQLVRRAAALLPPHDFALDVAVPIAREVGRRWERGQYGVAQEHLVSAQLQGALSSLLQFVPADPGAPRAVVATPPGERHALGVLVASLLALARGIEPVYLGTELPLEELDWAVDVSRAGLVLSAVVCEPEPGELESVAARLEAMARRVPVWIGCRDGHALCELASGPRWFHDFLSLDLALSHHATISAARRR
ncbi:MAG: MerR family transcriptional regulator [Myxococcota bacterium]